MTGSSDADGGTAHHARLGALRWDRTAGLWCATVDTALVRDREIGVTASDQPAALDRAADFLDWLRLNVPSIKATAAYQAFNYDLIWDDDLEESELAAKLSIQSVFVRNGFVEVWFDTAGVTTDHLLLAKLDGENKIVGMEL